MLVPGAPVRAVPIVNKGTKLGSETDGDLGLVAMTEVKTDDLLAPTNLLVFRIIKEFPSCGAKPVDDRLLAMACNPFTATALMNDLAMQSELCNDCAEAQLQDIGNGIKEKAMDPLVAPLALKSFQALIRLEILLPTVATQMTMKTKWTW